MMTFTPLALVAAVVFAPGKSEIVVAPNAASTVKYVADEVRGILSQALGADVPVVNAPTAGKASLVLGPNEWADAAGVTTNGLRRDQFRIRTAGDRVFVLGIDDANDAYRARAKGGIWYQNFQRATAFGAYDFLERFAGVRFYFPGELGTVVPRAARIEVPDTDFTDAPVYTHRHYTIYDGGEYFEGENRRELRHPGRTTCWWRNRMQTEYVPCCHGQNKFKYMERFAKSHPEYFALLPDGRRHNSPKITSPGHPGQICHSSAIWDEIYADARSYLLGEPASVRGIPVDSTLPNAPKRYGWGSNCQAGKYVDVMPQDGMIQCSCAACQAYYRGVEDRISWASELIWGRVAACGRRLKAAGVPGYITNLAYSKYRHVPKVEIPDNVLVMVAERGPWTDRDPAERAREIAEVKAWNAKIGRKVWMWTYSGKFAKLNLRGIPPITPKAIGRYYAMLAPWITGGYEELDSERFIHNYLNQYVLGKVMWNPSVDVEAIVDEHHRLMFGAAAPEMKRFFDAVEDVWLGQVAGKTLDTPLGPQSLSPSKRELFTTVYSPSLLAEWDGLFATAAKRVPEGSLEARRIALMKREILDWLEDAVNEFRAKCAKADACRVKGGRDAARAIVIDRDMGRGRARDAKAPVSTRVNVWKDADAYRFAFDCDEPAMDETSCVKDRAADDPKTWEDNGVEFFLNPSGDRLTLYQFQLSSDGKLADLRNGDVKWNSGATAKCVRTATGWRGEVSVPLAAFPEARPDGFPMNFARDRVTKNGVAFIGWALPEISNYHDIDNFAIVEFEDAGSVVFRPGQSEIVIAADAVSAVRVAADEAKEFMSGVLGVEVPVVNAPTAGKASLVLGANAWADAAGVTTNGLRRDAYRIRTAGGCVYVLGIDDANDAYRARTKGGIWYQNFQRATAFGTYDFLERFAGVRFYFPGELGTVVPRAARIAVPPTDLMCAPYNTVRRYSPYDHGRWFEGKDPDELRHPVKTVNWWRLRMETEYLPCCHGSNKFQYMDRFAKSHPEYFALLKDGRRHNSPKITYPGHPGQLCHSSAIWDEIYADAKSYLRGEPASVRGIPVDSTLPNAPRRYGWGSNCQAGKYVDVMPQDGMIPCACPRCQAVWDNVEDKVSWASELIWGNVAKAANRLKAEGVPGYLSNLAYSKYRHVPKVAIPDNVLVMVAERGPWTEADPDERARELAEYRAWNAKLGRRVWAWTYICRGKDDAGGAMTGIPCMTPKAVGRYFQQIQPYSFGAFLESEIGWSIFQYLNYYVFAKVMWDPSVDVGAILDEHHRLMFGAAAPEMKEFYETLEDLFIRQVAGRTFDTPLGPQSERRSEYELFMRIYTPQVLDRFDALFAAAEGKVAKGAIEARRIAFAHENIYGPLRTRARAYQANTDVKRGLARDAESKARNLIANGSFSEPKKGRMFGPWFGVADDAVTARDEKVFASAPASLRITPGTNATQCVTLYFRDAEKRMTLKKGQRYRLSYCIRLQDLEPTKLNGGAGVTIWDNKNVWIPPGGPFKGTQEWTYQTYEFTSDAHTGERQMPYINLRVMNARGTVWFDDVRLEEVE